MRSAFHSEEIALLKWLLVAILLGLVMLPWRITAAAKANLPRVNDPAPDFELPDQNGTLRSIREFRGRQPRGQIGHEIKCR